MDLKKSISVFIISLLYSTILYATEIPEILWRYTTGGRIITSPVEGDDGTIYFGSEDRFLYALKSNGNILWRTDLEDRITETLVLGPDGTIYTGSKRGFFLAVNPMGEKLWKVKLKGYPVGNPAIYSDGSLFVVTNEGWFYSLSHTGFIRWEIKLPAPPVMGPLIGQDIYIALNNERLYSYSFNGLKLWTFVLSGNVESLALSLNNIYIGTKNSTIVSIDYTGTRIWNKSLSGTVNSIIVMTEDHIICANGNKITMLDSKGNDIWNNNERRVILDLAAYSNEIISLDSEGNIFWLDDNGLILGQISGGVPGSNFMVSSEGKVYLGSKDWLFYKYGNNKIVKSNYVDYIWPSFRGGVKNTGYLLHKSSFDESDKIITSSDHVYFLESSGSLNENNLSDVLDEIEERLINRNFDEGKIYLIAILESMASDCVTRPLYEEGLLINDFPVIRSRAVEILGIVGNLKTIEFLVNLLKFEWDDYVITSILHSLGNLQSDKEEVITKGILNYYSDNKSNISQNYHRQILLTIQKLSRYNGYTNDSLLGIVTDIFINSSSRNTKEFALDTINSIKK